MRNFIRATALAASVLVLAGTGAVTAANAAAPSSHHASTKSPLSFAGPTPTGIHIIQRSQTQDDPTTNVLFNADIEVLVGNQDHYSVAAEGHLVLKKSHGTTYAGSFSDNMALKKYKASGTKVSTTAVNGTYTIYTGNGKFVVTETDGSEPSGRAPSKYGKGAEVGLQGGAHALTVHSNVKLNFGSFSAGGYIAPATGVLSFTTDGANFIVPRTAKNGVAGSYKYTTGGHTYLTHVTSWGEYEESNGSPEFVLFSLKIGKNVLHFNSESSTQNQNGELDGLAVTSVGGRTTYVAFEFLVPVTIQ